MGLFVRESNAPSDKYGSIAYYVDDNGFLRESNGPSDKYGAIVYYIDNDGFVRQSNGPSDKYGTIVYFVDDDGFVRKSNGPSDKYGAIILYVDDNGFVRKSNGPSDKYGAIVYYLHKEYKQQEVRKPSTNQGNGGILLALALVIGILLAPIIVVLGMFGKFLLKGLYKNVLQIEEFKKFRKTYSIICFSWFVLGIALTVLIFTLLPDFAEYGLYPLAIGNILLFALSIVFGNKIYKKHKDDIPAESDASSEVVFDGQTVKMETFSPAESQPEEFTAETESATECSAEEISMEYAPIASEAIQKNLYAIKKLKELLDIGAITKSEFDEKKKILLGEISAPKKKTTTKSSVKTEKCKNLILKISPILNIVALIALIVGIAFLVFTRFLGLVISNGHGEIYNGGYILHAFSGEILPLFTVVSTIIVSISLLIQLYFDISKSGSFKKTLIINLLAIAFNTVAVVFGFITANQYWRYSGILLFAILASVCLLFVVLRLALTIVSKLKHICIDEKREGGKKTLALVASALLFCFVCGSMIAGSTKEDVTAIDDFAFHYYQNLTSIVIPDSVTSIGNASFCGCANLTSVIIPNSVTSIGYSAFEDCTSLTSVVIGDGVTSIGDEAFCNCSSLTSITIPDSVTSIGDYAFYGVPLEKVTISTTTLSCISSCKETIKEVVISSGQSIGSYEFNGYYSLESIVIPESVTSIDFTAFVYCNNLKSIYYCGTEAQWNAILKENFELMDISNYTVTYNYTEN